MMLVMIFVGEPSSLRSSIRRRRLAVTWSNFPRMRIFS
jgi:hypothetical protein